jgi:hypothetical protein
MLEVAKSTMDGDDDRKTNSDEKNHKTDSDTFVIMCQMTDQIV